MTNFSLYRKVIQTLCLCFFFIFVFLLCFITDIEHNSLHSTVGSCYLSILYIIVCLHTHSQIPSLSLPYPFSLVTSLFISVWHPPRILKLWHIPWAQNTLPPQDCVFDSASNVGSAAHVLRTGDRLGASRCSAQLVRG